jgi:hypothetical protein
VVLAQAWTLSGMVQGLDRSRLPVVGMRLALMEGSEEPARLEGLKQVVAKSHQLRALRVGRPSLVLVVLEAVPLVSFQAVLPLRFLLVGSHHLVAYFPFSNRFNAYL